MFNMFMDLLLIIIQRYLQKTVTHNILMQFLHFWHQFTFFSPSLEMNPAPSWITAVELLPFSLKGNSQFSMQLQFT